MFELLISADAFVPDHGAAVKQAAAELGIRALDESTFTRNPHQRVEFSSSRVNKDRRVAPTMLEFISELDPGPGWQPDDDYDSVPEIGAAQGDRPARLHSTVVGVGDDGVYTLAERLARLGVAHRLSPPGNHYPIAGVTDVSVIGESAAAPDLTPAVTRAKDADAVVILFGGPSCTKAMQGVASVNIPGEDRVRAGVRPQGCRRGRQRWR